jgi:GAF domain-containing protein
MATGGSSRITDEQTALRRVATLVATGARSEAVFAAVTAEVGRLLEVDVTILSRYGPEGMQVSAGAVPATVLAAGVRSSVAAPLSVGAACGAS